ncbi:Gfo/Idh/MocA family oxidoreductase [Clostridium sp. E02]
MLSHGKHVMCEKTITSNQLELNKLVEIADKNHVVLQLSGTTISCNLC